MGHRPLEVIWRKRRYRCAERGCPQRVFTERSDEVPPRHRLTARLRARLEDAASRSARAVCDVAAEYGVSWWSVHRALVAAAAARATEAPPPVRMLGLDEARARSLHWTWANGAGWKLSNPWMPSLVDLDTDRPGWLLGLVPGRSGAAIEAWLAAQPQSWRDGIEVVALDPSAPFAAAIRRALPHATLVVDHWHLVRLANQALTEVRQRAARRLRERRGRKADPAWAHRRLLLAAGDRLGRRGLARLTHMLAVDYPTNALPHLGEEQGGEAAGTAEHVRTPVRSHAPLEAAVTALEAAVTATAPPS